MKFLPILPHDLTDEDIELLVRVSRRAYDGAQPGSFVESALQGLLQLWRVEDPFGLVGTSVVVGAQKTLVVNFIAVPGVLAHLEDLVFYLRYTAKVHDCSRIRALCRPGSAVERVYERFLGLRPLAHLYERTA